MSVDISFFLEPIRNLSSDDFPVGSLGKRITRYSEGAQFPTISKGDVVMFAIRDCRRSQTNVDQGFQKVRNSFGLLRDHFPATSIVDIGDIAAGDSVEDTYYAVTEVCTHIIKEGAVAVLLGGGQDLTYANYLAYEKLEQVVNLVCVDSRFDLGDVDDDIQADRFLQKIILHQPNVLFNFSNLGYQTYHIQLSEVELMQKLYFDIYRIGEVQFDLESVEPVVRNADVVSFDLSSIRTSDFACNYRSEPNGFFGQEACAIARYAGLSDKLSSIGFYEYDPELDPSGSASNLLAQILWYFVWGVAHRKGDYPFSDKENCIKYTVTIKNGNYNVVFYKSPRSDRWWMEVPYPSKRGVKYERHFVVPCSYSDYQMACREEIPNRWWQTFQKLG